VVTVLSLHLIIIIIIIHEFHGDTSLKQNFRAASVVKKQLLVVVTIFVPPWLTEKQTYRQTAFDQLNY